VERGVIFIRFIVTHVEHTASISAESVLSDDEEREMVIFKLGHEIRKGGIFGIA